MNSLMVGFSLRLKAGAMVDCAVGEDQPALREQAQMEMLAE